MHNTGPPLIPINSFSGYIQSPYPPYNHTGLNNKQIMRNNDLPHHVPRPFQVGFLFLYFWVKATNPLIKMALVSQNGRDLLAGIYQHIRTPEGI